MEREEEILIIPIYTVVEAKSVNELVNLVNIKTKLGWISQGGMCHAPNNFCESDGGQAYPYCQSMYRMEKPKRVMSVKFDAFPHESKESKKEKLAYKELKLNLVKASSKAFDSHLSKYKEYKAKARQVEKLAKPIRPARPGAYVDGKRNPAWWRSHHQLLKTKLTDFDLSSRVLNCLSVLSAQTHVRTLGQLISFNKNELLKLRNFGKGSLAELEDFLQAKGLQFGMKR